MKFLACIVVCLFLFGYADAGTVKFYTGPEVLKNEAQLTLKLSNSYKTLFFFSEQWAISLYQNAKKCWDLNKIMYVSSA